MVDLKDLRANPHDYQDSADKRGIRINVAEILKLDEERRGLTAQVEKLRSELKPSGKPTQAELEQLRQHKTKLEHLETKLRGVEEQLNIGLLSIPNRLAPGTPEGGEEANREERKWGEAKKRSVLDHVELAERNGWLDFERGAKTSGHKFYFLKGPLVKLELALMRLAIDLLEPEGFTLMSVPHLVTGRIANGTGFTPRGEESQIYQIEGEDLNLIATAEIPLTGYHADEILDNLPLAYAGLSPAYRKEAGAYGKHSKGLFRVHQFNKLEMYVFCRPNESAEWHQKLIGIEETVCRELEIPYRVVRIAAGDLGAPAYEKYDIEYWSPLEGTYRELMSCSNVTDFQARRLGVKFRTAEGTEFAHTLNGTAVAASRTLIALLENHQTEDGQVRLPKTLASYYGGDRL